MIILKKNKIIRNVKHNLINQSKDLIIMILSIFKTSNICFEIKASQ